MASRIVVALVAASCVLAGSAAFAYEQSKPSAVVHVTASEAFDLTSDASALAWADDVFIGTVCDAGTSRINTDDIPVTVFTVDVVSPIKGRAHGLVRVAQFGGLNRATHETAVVEGVTPIRQGATYLFATRVSTLGFHLVPTGRNPQLVSQPLLTAAQWLQQARSVRPDPLIAKYPSDLAKLTPTQVAERYSAAQA